MLLRKLFLLPLFLFPLLTNAYVEDLNPDAYYDLDESSGVRYDSVASFDLTSINAVSSAAGALNYSADFVAANSHRLYNSAITSTNGSVSYSVSFWLKTTTKNTTSVIVTRTTPDNSRWFLEFGNNTTTGYQFASFGFVNAGNQGVSVTSAVNVADGNWHHVAASIYNNATPRAAIDLYIDGNFIGTGVHGSLTYSLPSDFEHLNIGGGRNYTSPESFYRYHNGQVDELAFWVDYKLTGSDVTDLYNTGTPLAYSSGGISSSSSSTTVTVDLSDVSFALTIIIFFLSFFFFAMIFNMFKKEKR